MPTAPTSSPRFYHHTQYVFACLIAIAGGVVVQLGRAGVHAGEVWPSNLYVSLVALIFLLVRLAWVGVKPAQVTPDAMRLLQAATAALAFTLLALVGIFHEPLLFYLTDFIAAGALVLVALGCSRAPIVDSRIGVHGAAVLREKNTSAGARAVGEHRSSAARAKSKKKNRKRKR